MVFYIREWPNKTATLMADTGAVLWTFANVEEAQAVCEEWYQVQKQNLRYYVDYVDVDYVDNLDPSGSSCSVA